MPHAFGLWLCSHSLAAGPDGQLPDVNPYLDERPQDFANRFARHPGSDNQFDTGAMERRGLEGVVENPAVIAQAIANLEVSAPWNEEDDA